MNSKGESTDEPLSEDVKNGFEMMQHLINEMDKSSQRIDEFNKDELENTAKRSQNEKHRFDLLYDEAWKSEDSDAASLKEVPVDFFDKAGGDSGCEDAVTSAIAEVSKDFLTGLRASAIRNQDGDSDDSHISSDNDFKLIKGMPAYARYPETATGLSDTDWNPYGTESDTNISPRVPSQETPGGRVLGSKLSGMVSFNPPLHSTDLEAVTPSFAVGSIPNTCTRKQDLHDISEQENVISLKPDVTADFSSISHVSEQTFNGLKELREPPKLSDLNKTMRGNELEDFGKNSKGNSNGIPNYQNESISEHLPLSIASKSSSRFKTLEGSYISVMDRAKLMGVPEDIVDGKHVFDSSQGSKISKQVKNGNNKPHVSDQGDASDDDILGRKVKKVLQDTKYLDRDQENRKTINEVAIDYSSLQKDLQEIQESLNQNLGPGSLSSVVRNEAKKNDSKNTPPSSDNDGDIIPSTTTTPERKRNRMAWDFAGDLASGQIGSRMEEVSLNTLRNSSSSQRPSTDKQSYNSDGDETRTSGSSDKMDDHAAADQALAEMSAVLRPHRQLMMTAAQGGPPQGISSAQDVDEMLSNFRDQRRELETRYQQLSNPGLADKVFRILTSQDPEAQADGILSQVTAQEREERARYALGLHSNYNLNFSTDTDNLNTTSQSFSLPDDVRRRLDLSGLSSADGSKVADKSSFVLPSIKGFAAFDGVTKFLSSQMEKVSEKTFNHSLEMHIPPQVTTCYPVMADYDGKDQEKRNNALVTDVPSTNEHTSADLFSGHLPEEEPTATSSPVEALTDERKSVKDNNQSSPEDSDSSSGKKKEKYRPYRPPGSKEFYYTESDAASIADSVTTIESTHIGSDDAKGPNLPSSALGSRKDPLTSGGIYAKHKALSSLPEGSLPPIHEKSVLDDRDSESNQSSKGSKNSKTQDASRKDTATKMAGSSKNNQKSNVGAVTSEADSNIQMGSNIPTSAGSYSMGVAAARRDAQWDNRLREQRQDPLRHEPFPNKEDAMTELKELSDLGGTSTYFQRQREHENKILLESQRNLGIDEPVSLKVKMTYTKDREDKQSHESEDRGKRNLRDDRNVDHGCESIRERDESRYSVFQTESSRPLPNSYFDRENNGYVEEKNIAHRRRSWDEDALSPVRDARLSPAFHQALSTELRQAIGARSPLLSQNIERSLAQAPLASASHLQHSKNDDGLHRRSASPPPTFLARERGQPLREYAHSPVATGQRANVGRARQAWEDRGERDEALSYSNQNFRRRSPPHLDDNNRCFSPSSNLSQPQVQRSPSPVEQRRQANPSLRVNVKSDPQPQSPMSVKKSISPQRLQERTLENMTSESENTDIDREPLSRRAQMLTAALPQERDISPDINSLWDRFKALNESNDSSMDSSRIGAITDLLRNPSQHLIAQYLKEREEYRIERQERAEEDRLRRLRDQQTLGMPQLHSSSEDDFNGGYREMIAKKEEERIKRRAAKKKKGKPVDTSKGRQNLEGERNKENIPDGLFSIPEDAGSDQTPMKGSTSQKPLKSKSDAKYQQADVIDPNMQKLREKISKQRGKIDKQTLKEFHRMEKLKKLEHLLSAKKHGHISDQTLEDQLGELSATSTPGSNSSGENENGNSNSRHAPFSEDSTTAKDSSAEMHAWKAEKERRLKEAKSIEMERRKEFKSKQNMDLREMNKNTNRKGAMHNAGNKAQTSELKLLKLVNDGFLTAEEAYRLAIERAQQEKEVEESSICSYSSSEDLSALNRPHRLYSPYARRDEFHDVRSKHVPKLKQLSPTTFVAAEPAMSLRSHNRFQQKLKKGNTSEMEDFTGKILSRPSRSTSPHQLRFSKSQVGARSPSSHYRDGAAGIKPHSLQRQKIDLHRSSKRTDSSPPRKYLPHNHHHHRQQKGGERYPTRQDFLKQGWNMESPASAKAKGISWQIPMDVHPSKWEEPQPTGEQANGQAYNMKHGNRTKRREQLPLPDLQTPDSPESEEEPEPQKERHTTGDDFWYKADHPQGIPQELWQEVVSQDALASKVNHCEVDPLMDRVQYILNRESPAGAGDEHALGMTLQEAFLARKQIFISKCRERQKRIALARENRHLQECLRLEREAIFSEQDRPPAPNLHAHPCSENLYQPKQRVFTKNEMKALTQKRYKKLHEVVQKQEKQKAEAESKLNRLRVRLFNKKVQRGVLKKMPMRQR